MTKITGDWLVCPLDEASRAVSVADFAVDPRLLEVHRPHKTTKQAAANNVAKLERPVRATIPRRHDLDALRAFAMLLGIALHGALAYMPMPAAGWSVHDPRQHAAFGIFMAAVHGFRMPVFFLVSGFFTAMLWRKRGLLALLLQRAKRIAAPLAIGMFTIVPAVWVTGFGAGMLMSLTGTEPPANLWTAAREGDVAGIAAHLAAGAAPDERDSAAGQTPLSMAAARGHLEAVEQLLAGSADVNARNRDGSTALHNAAFFGQVEVAELLLENGARATAKNRNGETPADRLAVSWQQTVIISELSGNKMDLQQILAGREQVALLLMPSDSPAPAETAVAVGSTDGGRAGANDGAGPDANPAAIGFGVLMLLLVFFPVFMHLWFLWFLCWLVGMFAIYAKLSDYIRWQLPDWLITSPLRYAWLIPLTVLPQSLMGTLYPNFGPDTSVGLIPLPEILLYYAIFFFFGAWYFDCDDQAGRVGRWWPVTLPLALLVVFPLGYELTIGGFGFSNRWLDLGWHRPLGVALQVLYAWLMTFGLMGLFRNLMTTESKAIRYVSDSSFWLYLAHLPLIVVAQALVVTWPLPASVKFFLVCTVTTALLLLSYQLFIRYTPIGTLLNGPRKRPEWAMDAVVIEPTGVEP